MSDPIYITSLGSGLYLDSNGVLHQAAIPDLPIYAVPGGLLTIDPSKLAKTFKDIGDALPNESDGKKFTDFKSKLAFLGDSDEIATLLGKVGEIG